MPRGTELLTDDPLWYKDAIIYELHIKAFFDSDGDGVGDFRGLTMKLDYLRDLGVTAVWLLPFYPSPLKDDGYDIADFFNINPRYGVLRDFREFLRQAHKRGIRVITELVLNHTSDQHPWFQRARRAKPGSVYRDFYVWSDNPSRYSDARIIFQDFEPSNWTWDAEAKAYYWHRFYSHQPDLNYDNPHVQKAMFRVIDYWMRMGVDGMRLDAVPYLFEREGTNCENLPETYEYLKRLRQHVDAKFKNRMLLAEANQWPEDAVAYFGNGDMCNMAFHFPLMPRMFMSVQMEDSFPIVDILDQTPPISANCQWALFLRNHDELTLEMVTDEERDYMYRIYARDPRARINLGIRRRLAPLLGNDQRKIRLMYGLLFCMPGTPVVYYGNEICMGDNYYLGDRDGVRTPMQWSPDKNAGFSTADPQQLYLPVVIDYSYHYQTMNVENHEKNPASILWFMRHLIALRKRFSAFGRGSMQIVASTNNKVFSFIREYGDEKILVAVNLSRLPQMTTLDLSDYAGLVPEELMGRNKFHQIQKSPYVLTFDPYGGYLFSLGDAEGQSCVVLSGGSGLAASVHWSEIFEGKKREVLEAEVLPEYIGGCRWFGGKARQIQEIKILEVISLPKEHLHVRMVLMSVEYIEGLPDMFVIPLGYAEGDEARKISSDFPAAVISPLRVGGREGILYDSLYNEEFCSELLWVMARHRRLKTNSAELSGFPGKNFRYDVLTTGLRPKVLAADQSNTSILYGEDYFFKLYRNPDEGMNPDLELTRFLTEEAGFPYSPSFAGALELRRRGAAPITLGLLIDYVQNQGTALEFFFSGLQGFYEQVLSRRADLPEIPETCEHLLDLAMSENPPELVGDLHPGVPEEMVSLLGIRTAQMHRALGSGSTESGFAPEKFSGLSQRASFQSLQSTQKRVFQLLSAGISHLPAEVAAEASQLVARSGEIVSIFRSILNGKISAGRIRIHGDYHLGQVLYTGKDYVIIDFEGEPARPLSERRLKLSPMRDVAGMIRSFHYAAYIALLRNSQVRAEDVPVLEPWAEMWYTSMSAVFLRAYLGTMKGSGLIPERTDELKTLFNCFLLNKAIYELGYELNNRPEWVVIPARGIRYLLDSAGPSPKKE